MMKRAISVLLVLVLALSTVPVTAGAAENRGKRLDTPQTYNTIFLEYEPNDTMAMADWFDPVYSDVRGVIGGGDTYDWYSFTITGDQQLYFHGLSGAWGCNTTSFKLFDASGALIRTMDYCGDDGTNDIFDSDVSLAAGKYYIRVSDPVNLASYSFETFLCPLIESPKVSASNRASDGKVVLSWDAIEAADGYTVVRSTSKNGTYSVIADLGPGITSYTDTSAKAGKTYYYKVRTVSYDFNCLSSLFSAPVSRTCDLPRPTGMKITLNTTTGKNKISWNAVSGADKYTLYIYDAGGSLVKSTTTTGTSLTHGSATLGVTYTYKVRAVDSSNSSANSAYSGAVKGKAICAKPVISLSNVDSTGKIQVSWTKVTGAKSYDLYRSTDGTNWTKAASTTGTSLKHNSAKAGEVWYYKVIARGAVAGTDSKSSAAKYRTCDLPAPVLTLTANSKGKPRLSWTAVSGAVKYKVYGSTDGVSFSLLSTVTGTAVTHSSAKSGVTYYYKIMAVASRTSANSACSNVRAMTAR